MSSGLKLEFWDWKRPVLAHASDALLDGWTGGVLDLSDKVLIVPTAETGRRLREELAQRVAEQGGAVMAPYVWSPEVVLGQGVDRETIATALQEQLAWARVFEDIRSEDVQALMPRLDEDRGEDWALGMAESMRQLKRVLGAGGVEMVDVLEVVKEGRDVERWQDLAGLEEKYFAVLEAMGLEDAQRARRIAAERGEVPEGVKEVWVLAVADPPKLLKEWMGCVAGRQEVPVRVFVHASPEVAGMFDAFGTPDWEKWGQGQGLDLGLNDEDLWMEADAEEQAVKVVSLLKELAMKDLEVGVGCADAGLLAKLEGELSAEGLRVFDPAGKSSIGHPIVVLLRGWLDLVRSGTWSEVRRFLNHADVLRVVVSEREDKKIPQYRLLQELDKLNEKHLPISLETAVQLCEKDEVREVLIGLLQRVRQWEKLSLLEGVNVVLDWVYGKRQFNTSKVEDADEVMLLGEALRLASELDEARQMTGTKISTGGLLQLLIEELSGKELTDVRGEVDLVLHGWLELHWEPAPGLVIAGFNEEFVPGIVTGDAFLPDTLRKRLGLACQASRRARDAYLLKAMKEQRRNGGALKLVLGRVNDDGDGLRPSRLLFDCRDEKLVDRVRKLFPAKQYGDEEQEMKVPPRHLGFRLKPRLVEKPLEKISPSGLKEYLRCPFRYYLRFILRMEEVNADIQEASPSLFGDLMHEVFQEYAMDDQMQDCIDENAVANWMENQVVKTWERHFGKQPWFSVVMQMESAKQRARAAARELARLRSEGWRTILVEGVEVAELKANRDKLKEQNRRSLGLTLSDVPLHGRIDRVDRRVLPSGGGAEYLVLDYKTGSVEKPQKAHLGKMSEDEQNDDRINWQYCKAVKQRWKDLQLPLYVLAMQKRFPDAIVRAGYFHIPAVSSKNRVEVWEQLDDELLADARRCAAVAVSRIREGIFWPPSEIDERYDSYGFLLGNPEATVDPVELMKDNHLQGGGL